MEVVAGLTLALLGSGYYLNKEEAQNSSVTQEVRQEVQQVKPDFQPEAPQAQVQAQTNVQVPRVVSNIQQSGGSAQSKGFDHQLIGAFTPDYQDTRSTHSNTKRANTAYNPQAIFQHIDPDAQQYIQSRVNLDKIRQQNRQFPNVVSVQGILNNNMQGSKGSEADKGLGVYRGIGSGSSSDSGQQAPVSHRIDTDRPSDLAHNNMVPFFGSRVTQSTESDNRLAAHKLELYTGQYNLRQQNKQETKKLFPPIANLTNPNGTHEQRDLSRWFPNNTGKRNNELPFERINVGPGLNQGFEARPSGGYHDQIRILPKRNEELYVNPRTETKGKIIYGGALVPERGKIGQVYKYTPELLVDNRCGQRNFTTTGEVLKPRVRSGVILKNTERSQFSGPLNVNPATYTVSQNVKESLVPRSKLSNKQNFDNTPHRNLQQNHGKRMQDLGRSGYQNRPNERAVTGPRSFQQAFRDLTRSAKNAIQRFYDPAKYTLKQEYVLHARPYGNLDGPSKHTVYDPNYAARTTIRETTEDQNHMGSVNSIPQRKHVAYDPNYAARTTIRETTEDNQHSGSLNRKSMQNGLGYQTGNWTPRNTQKQFTSNYEYTGSAGAVENKAAISYDAAYNAELNVDKECVARGRDPTQNSVKLNKGKEYVNIEVKKIECDEYERRDKVKDSTAGNRFNPNAVSECTLTSFKNIPQEDYHRLDPTLLEPFRNNGLTQSLHSY